MGTTGSDQFIDWMRRRGFTQADAARYLDEPESFISRLKTGEDRPGLQKAIKIYRLTGIPVEFWAADDEDEATADLAASAKRRVAK